MNYNIDKRPADQAPRAAAAFSHVSCTALCALHELGYERPHSRTFLRRMMRIILQGRQAASKKKRIHNCRTQL